MTIVHSEAPWGQPEEERLAPKERTHPMRPLSRNNNTTTRLKRGPNPLSEVLILVLNFLSLLFIFCFCFCLFLFLFCILSFFLYLFVCLFLLLLLFFIFLFLLLFSFFYIYMRLYVVPLRTTTTDHQVPRLHRKK